MTRWKCRKCSYVYDPMRGDPDGGIAPGTPFARIPDSWRCPVCGATKADFFELAVPAQSPRAAGRPGSIAPPLPPPPAPAPPASAAPPADPARPPEAARPTVEGLSWTVGPLKGQRLV